MNAALNTMLSRYSLSGPDDYLRALREVIQQICLLGLWRSKFFESAAFYGGTALRIFHGLSRFSEDMDFSLVGPNKAFTLMPFGEGMVNELESFGFRVSFERKDKEPAKKIESAFLKTNTLQSMLLIDTPARITDRLHRDARLKIKLEVDTDPPPFADYTMQSLLVPIPFQVRLYDQPSLFAGKLHALLCRSWKSRLKGRDFYDFVWFVGMKVPCNLQHLRARMIHTGNLSADAAWDHAALVEHLHARFDSVDFAQAVHDVAPFVTDRMSLDLWSREFFHTLADQILSQQ